MLSEFVFILNPIRPQCDFFCFCFIIVDPGEKVSDAYGTAYGPSSAVHASHTQSCAGTCTIARLLPESVGCILANRLAVLDPDCYKLIGLVAPQRYAVQTRCMSKDVLIRPNLGT